MKYQNYNPLFPWPVDPVTGKKMKFTSMAIEIDDHFYDEDADPDRMISLMYALIFMLACKTPNFFKDLRDYDNFAAGLATNLFLRYRKAADNPSLPRIKSVLNYIKNIIGVQRITYQKNNFSQV